MSVTNNLKLPQYTEDDIFDLQDINKAYDSIDKAYGDIDDTRKGVVNIKSELELANSRINNIVAESGDVANNTELLDIRIGANGVAYDISGDGARESLKQVITFPTNYWTKGNVSISGVKGNSWKSNVTEFTNLTPGEMYIFKIGQYSGTNETTIAMIQFLDKENSVLTSENISVTNSNDVVIMVPLLAVKTRITLYLTMATQLTESKTAKFSRISLIKKGANPKVKDNVEITIPKSVLKSMVNINSLANATVTTVRERVELIYTLGQINNSGVISNANFGFYSNEFTSLDDTDVTINFDTLDITMYRVICHIWNTDNSYYSSFELSNNKTFHLDEGKKYRLFIYHKSYSNIISLLDSLKEKIKLFKSTYKEETTDNISISSDLLKMRRYAIFDWYLSDWCSYGDSITQIGNLNAKTSWQYIVSNYFKFRNHYGRGVGSSTFIKSNQIWYANSDGSYNSRDIDGECPSGCTPHKGYLCSWDRIKTMIPKNVKLVWLMGGTNDFGASAIEGDFTWVAGSKEDVDWANDTTYYNGGDFKINTFKGAVCSAIMKIQAWCPNAVIVVASPLSGRGLKSGENMTSEVVINSKTTRDFRNYLEECSIYMSKDFVDIFSTTGINQFNRKDYISDTVHPYQIGSENKGNEALARAVINGLKKISPYL